MHTLSLDVDIPSDYHQTLYMGTSDGGVNISSMVVESGWNFGTVYYKQNPTTGPVTSIKANHKKPYRVLIAYKKGQGCVWNIMVKDYRNYM